MSDWPIYPFDFPHDAPLSELKAVLGGKGASLWAMTAELGLPVPAGFTVAVPAQKAVMESGVGDGLMAQVMEHVATVEQKMGREFGAPEDPLLLSVRSGAAVSMPGMMDTILNVGLTQRSAAGLASVTGDADFAQDTYRRFLSQFAETVFGLEARDPTVQGLRSAIGKVWDPALLDDSQAILARCIQAVSDSWNSPRARYYRRKQGLSDLGGTAVNIQAMVFGNRDARSGTGVVFTRDPATGEASPTGDYLPEAQGEDVVAGLATTLPYAALETRNPEAHAAMARAMRALEQYYADMVDIEFTVESGKLWILQARSGKRTPASAARIAIDMAEDDDFTLDRRGALARLPEGYLESGGAVETAAASTCLARGVGASPGLATGVAVFSSEDAVDMSEDHDIILVRQETSPADIHGMSVAKGILTSLGGKMSHAAVVARDWSLPAVVGADGLAISGQAFTCGDVTVRQGDTISIDGATGEVFLGMAAGTATVDPALATLRQWAAELSATV